MTATTTNTTRSDYTAKMKLQIDELNSQIDALELKAHNAREDARDTYKAEMTKLRHQSSLAAAQMAELKLAGEQSWDKAMAEMDKIRDAFVRSFHYFKTQI